MEPAYLVYSIRLHGWINNQGGAGTDRTAARTFTHDEALQYCADRRTHEGAAVCYPVLADDLIRIEAAK